MGVHFTNRELDVMSIVWRLGSATVNEVQGELGDRLAYTSVMTILKTIESKGHLRHEMEGQRDHDTDSPEMGRSGIHDAGSQNNGALSEAHLSRPGSLQPARLCPGSALLQGSRRAEIYQ